LRLLRLGILVFVLVGILSCATAGYGQSTTQYIYDANGRLSGVIGPNGDAVIYRYDPAGNLVSIDHITAGSFAVLSFSPQAGVVGDQVTISGIGLDTASSVSFNGVASPILSASANSLLVKVPAGATTGPISASGVLGTASSSDPFIVVSVAIVPNQTTLLAGHQQQFQASVIGALDQQVNWSVNGTAGGNAGIGTIDATGLYSAPGTTGLTVTIGATAHFASNVTGQATARILNPENAAVAQSALLSVHLGTQGLPQVVSHPVSVSTVAATGIFFDTVFSPLLGVQFGTSARALAQPVSATTGPVVTAISPGALSRGAATPVSLSGQNLTGAGSIEFSLPGAGLDPQITAGNIVVTADGTAVTFNVAIGAGAAPGQRVVLVVTPNGTSLGVASSGNTVQIQ